MTKRKCFSLLPIVVVATAGLESCGMTIPGAPTTPGGAITPGAPKDPGRLLNCGSATPGGGSPTVGYNRPYAISSHTL